MSGISFKITAPGRPSSSASNAPPSRPQSRSTSRHQSHHNEASEDDSDDDDAFRRASGRDNKRRRVGEEEVVEFGKDGATSKHSKPPPAAPLVIPALPNKDWRQAAEELRAGRKSGRKREMYLPEKGGGMRMREVEGSGNGTPISEAEVDAINTQEVVGGLEKREKKIKMELDEASSELQAKIEMPPPPIQPKTEESEERRALRELLGEGASAGETEEVAVEAIYSAEDARNGPIEEADAFKRDVDSRPDQASLDDYARVPVGAFGLAMLRGMGWQPGQAASRSGRGAIEAHVPSSRPSLLGIGAKPMAEAIGDDGKKGAKGKNGSGGKSRREEMKFVPLVKQAREGSTSGRSTPLPITDGSASSSRRASRSPPPSSSSRRDRDTRNRSPRRDRERDDRRSSRYDDDDRRSRRDDERKSSRYDEERRGSSRRDDGDRRRESDKDDRRRRDEKDSYRDDRRRREERDGYRDRKGDRSRD